MAASPPKIWFSANTGISKCGRARAETFKALPLTGGGPFRYGPQFVLPMLAEAPAGN
jgi:hypothetical protein